MQYNEDEEFIIFCKVKHFTQRNQCGKVHFMHLVIVENRVENVKNVKHIAFHNENVKYCRK